MHPEGEEGADMTHPPTHTNTRAPRRTGRDRSCQQSRDAVFLIGSLPRPSWTRMRALAYRISQESRRAGRPAGRRRHALLLLGGQIKVRARPVSSALVFPATREGVQRKVFIRMALYASCCGAGTRASMATETGGPGLVRIQNGGVSWGMPPCTRACSGGRACWWGRGRGV